MTVTSIASHRLDPGVFGAFKILQNNDWAQTSENIRGIKEDVEQLHPAELSASGVMADIDICQQPGKLPLRETHTTERHHDRATLDKASEKYRIYTEETLTLDRKRLGERDRSGGSAYGVRRKCRNSLAAGDISLKQANTRFSDGVGMKGNQQEQVITQKPSYN
ncbi:hypothetical protein GTR04_4050 [Trichophyton interdigitale]|uniref:Uncharacterized protein n=1 Tax=Trichophyton interdigitale TaxID=101480 RepID=A0A9P5CV13_9EURO|nr:hypothetical protein GY632_4289 [Trichophyton interdigitale]KAF3897794.1 hypothetical protein GY631_1439 [Trichophyton interdigitale]KAG8208575.1 hypothetical protein GTR04_4050 [Trichophyton interdigitale]